MPKWWLKLRFWVWVFIPVALLILPANFFDAYPSICISQLLLKQECYGCGITRASQHAIHFDFGAAWQYNKLFVIVVPLLAWVWFDTARKYYQAAKL